MLLSLFFCSLPEPVPCHEDSRNVAAIQALGTCLCQALWGLLPDETGASHPRFAVGKRSHGRTSHLLTVSSRPEAGARGRQFEPVSLMKAGFWERWQHCHRQVQGRGGA